MPKQMLLFPNQRLLIEKNAPKAKSQYQVASYKMFFKVPYRLKQTLINKKLLIETLL